MQQRVRGAAVRGQSHARTHVRGSEAAHGFVFEAALLAGVPPALLSDPTWGEVVAQIRGAAASAANLQAAAAAAEAASASAAQASIQKETIPRELVQLEEFFAGNEQAFTGLSALRKWAEARASPASTSCAAHDGAAHPVLDDHMEDDDILEYAAAALQSADADGKGNAEAKKRVQEVLRAVSAAKTDKVLKKSKATLQG